jgi:methylenetetrahydrofolate dehydrogenase (NADP+)/methenyltetrahydrofolate cyclohydrolase
MSKILDGKKLSESLAGKLVERIAKAKFKALAPADPKLVIIQVGTLEESNTYIKKKRLFAEKIGVQVVHKQYGNSTPENDIVSDIAKYNSDPSVHGIMVQLPLPTGMNTDKILEAIDGKKDVDGLTALNTKLLFDGQTAFISATTKGVMTMLHHYKINLAGKRAVVVGDSILVGRPTAFALLNEGATVTVCHSRTKNLPEETKRADILVVAVGKPHLITSKHVSRGQVIIDVGINVTKKGLVGDVDFNKVKGIVKAITPVPGGVGPMTVYSLFDNLVSAYEVSLQK